MQKFNSKIALLTLLLTAYIPSNYAQISKQIRTILTQQEHYSFQMASNMVPNSGNLIATIGEDSFFNPNGTQYLFKIVQGKAIRLDQCQLHGFNFNRLFFEFESNLYTIGGYGFYKNTNVLQKFNFQTAEWDLIPIKDNSEKGILGVTYQSNNKIICLVNLQPGNTAFQDIQDNSPFSINLKSMQYKKEFCDTSLLNQIQFKPDIKQFYLSDYFVFKSLHKTIIIHTSSNQYIVVPNNMYKLWSIEEQEELCFNGNTISFSNQSIVDSNSSVSIDFDKIWNDKIFKKRLVLLNNNETTDDWNWLFFILISSLITAGIVLLIKHITRNTKTTTKSEEQTNTINYQSDYNYPFLDKLKQMSPSCLTTDQLDSLFDISHMELNSRKTKRNRLIDKINNRFPGAIKRERDGNDRRLIIYKINIQDS